MLLYLVRHGHATNQSSGHMSGHYDFPLSENSNLSPRPDFYLSYQIRPYLSYQLKKNLKIQLRPDFRIQNYGKLEFYNNMKFSSILTGVQTAIVFDLFK